MNSQRKTVAGICTAADFRRVGAEGMGNPRAKNAQSMAWFKDRLYVGLTHHSGDGPEDQARIVRYDPLQDSWDVVYESPLVPVDDRARASHVFKIGRTRTGAATEVPQYRGYRGMTVFQGASDPQPALYVGTLSHWGAQILRSEDGEHFDVVSEPGLGNKDILSFRQLVPYRDRLFAAHAGSVSEEMLDRNFGETSALFTSRDPASSDWQLASTPGFGSEDNRAIFGMCVFAGQIYAGTGNAETGFEVWKTSADGEPPFVWKPVVRNGAYRFNLNEVAVAMVPFKDGLYIGTGLPGLGYDKTNDVGPAAAELIRINADDSWDLVMGTPRFTPDGFKVPLSAMGPGFDDFDNSVCWSMGVHEGALYVGTNNIHTWSVALEGGKTMTGGAQVWATEDGESWECVSDDGFGNPYAVGIRTFMSTPAGFFIGTSNHQEVEKFWLRRTRSKGEPSSAGGAEIWLAC